MQTNLLTLIEHKITKAVAFSCLLVVNRLWQVKRHNIWPPFAEY